MLNVKALLTTDPTFCNKPLGCWQITWLYCWTNDMVDWRVLSETERPNNHSENTTSLEINCAAALMVRWNFQLLSVTPWCTFKWNSKALRLWTNWKKTMFGQLTAGQAGEIFLCQPKFPNVTSLLTGFINLLPLRG